MATASKETSVEGDDAKIDLASLVTLHQAGVWRYLRALGCDASLADDLTQDTFLEAWRYTKQGSVVDLKDMERMLKRRAQAKYTPYISSTFLVYVRFTELWRHLHSHAAG